MGRYEGFKQTNIIIFIIHNASDFFLTNFVTLGFRIVFKDNLGIFFSSVNSIGVESKKKKNLKKLEGINK